MSLPCYLHLFSLFVVVSSIGEFTLLVPSPLFFMCFCVFPVRNNFVGQKLIRSFLRCHERRLRPFFDMSHDVYSLWCFTKTYFWWKKLAQLALQLFGGCFTVLVTSPLCFLVWFFCFSSSKLFILSCFFCFFVFFFILVISTAEQCS